MLEHPLKPICDAWIDKIKRASELRKRFDEAAWDANQFYSSACGFLWSSEYKRRFWKEDSGYVAPKFQLTLNRIFEAVAQLGPSLYWRVPRRTAAPKKMFELDPDLAQVAQADPQFAQIYQAAMAEEARTMPARRLRAFLMQKLLNASAAECKLAQSGQMATTDSLLTGRGCLWTAPYVPPGSNQTIVSSWWDSPQNLYIDPDSLSPSFDDAWWIAQRCIEPIWKIEREREHLGIKPGSLKKYGSYASANAQAELWTAPETARIEQWKSESTDLMIYFKVYSRMGCGSRLTNVDWDLKQSLDDVLGDYCYIEVAPNVPYPLNFPTHLLADEMLPDAQIRQAFQWPCPFWRDRRWPVNSLDYYPSTLSPYPIGPFEAGMGELKALNFFFAHAIEHTHTSMRTFMVVAQRAAADFKRAVAEGKDFSILYTEASDNIKELLSFIDHPPMQTDVWKVMAELGQTWDRRVGVSDQYFGQQEDSQSRSATDSRIRAGNINVRPEYMASKVSEWQAEVAKTEAIGNRWFLQPQDTVYVLGNTGAYLYKTLIQDQPVEATLLEIDYDVDAHSGRRPNKDRDTENTKALTQMLMPVADKHADVTTDTGPLNELIRLNGKAMEADVDRLMFNQRVPLMAQIQLQQQTQAANDPNAQSQQQQAMAQQQQMHQMEMQKRAADAQGKMVETQAKAEQARIETEQKAQELQIDAVRAQMEMRKMAAETDAARLRAEVVQKQKALVGRKRPA
jgi:hypothetical protein